MSRSFLLRVSIPSLVVMTTSALFPIDSGSVYAQSSSCAQVINAVRSDVEERLGGRISHSAYAEGILDNSPTSRKDQLSIQLGVKREGPPLTPSQEQANANILASRELIGKYVQAIFNRCDGIAQVEIGRAWTSGGYVFSLYSDGQVREDECLPSHEHQNLDSKYLRWGTRLCS